MPRKTAVTDTIVLEIPAPPPPAAEIIRELTKLIRYGVGNRADPVKMAWALTTASFKLKDYEKALEAERMLANYLGTRPSELRRKTPVATKRPTARRKSKVRDAA